MAPPSDVELLKRFWRFELELDALVAEGIEPVADGLTLVSDTRIPTVWDANYLVVERDGFAAAEIAAEADEAIGGMGMNHRTVCVREPVSGEPLVAGFEELGWKVERSLYMVLRREPERPPSIAVEEAEFDEAAPVRRAMIFERDGDELTFIVADADDWPKHLYERLGFDPVGVICVFRHRPS